MLAGVAGPVPFPGEVEQDLRDGQAQQFGIGQQRRATDPATADDVIVEEHVECGQKGIEVCLHKLTSIPFAMLQSSPHCRAAKTSDSII